MRVSGFGCRVWGVEFRCLGVRLGFRVWGSKPRAAPQKRRVAEPEKCEGKRCESAGMRT